MDARISMVKEGWRGERRKEEKGESRGTMISSRVTNITVQPMFHSNRH